MLNFRIRASGKISDFFMQEGIADFKAATAYIRQLRYERISNTSDVSLVFIERRGTCSSKHAVLAELANEQAQNISLRLGFYEMNGDNTPGVGGVLQKHNLQSILEAHCYLEHDGRRFDFTRPVASESMDLSIISEEEITSKQIGEYKNRRHRGAMNEWLKLRAMSYSLDEAWNIREECIGAIS